MNYNPSIKKIFEIMPDSRLVGGCVRDLLHGVHPKDYDFATPLLPQTVTALFEDKGISVKPTGLQHGTVTVILDHVGYEITTLRKDVETDGRHATVEFVTDWREDALRRDFTFNAMSMDANGKIYDYFDGQTDLKNNHVRFVGNADERIKEDALRILRYYRFVTRFNDHRADSQAMSAIENNKSMIEKLSVERIYSELYQIFSHKNQNLAVNLIKENDTAIEIFGSQGTNCYYDYTDVTEPDPIISFALIADSLNYMNRFKAPALINKRVNQAIDVEQTPMNEHDIKVLMLKGYDSTTITAKMIVNHHYIDININNIQKPVFPLRGQDYLDLGYQGLQIKHKMNQAMQKWINSDFTLTKESLLKDKNGLDLI